MEARETGWKLTGGEFIDGNKLATIQTLLFSLCDLASRNWLETPKEVTLIGLSNYPAQHAGHKKTCPPSMSDIKTLPATARLAERGGDGASLLCSQSVLLGVWAE